MNPFRVSSLEDVEDLVADHGYEWDLTVFLQNKLAAVRGMKEAQSLLRKEKHHRRWKIGHSMKLARAAQIDAKLAATHTLLGKLIARTDAAARRSVRVGSSSADGSSAAGSSTSIHRVAAADRGGVPVRGVPVVVDRLDPAGRVPVVHRSGHAARGVRVVDRFAPRAASPSTTAPHLLAASPSSTASTPRAASPSSTASPPRATSPSSTDPYPRAASSASSTPSPRAASPPTLRPRGIVAFKDAQKLAKLGEDMEGMCLYPVQLLGESVRGVGQDCMRLKKGPHALHEQLVNVRERLVTVWDSPVRVKDLTLT
ncbi:hypothetical protein ACP4OV_026140 [Aristida adscensionis]